MSAIKTACVKRRKSQDSYVTSSSTYGTSANDVKSGITLNQLDVYSLAYLFSFLSWKDKSSMQLVSKKCKLAVDSTWCFNKVFESNEESVDSRGRRADDFHESYFMPHCAKYLRKYKKQVNFPITTKHFEVLQRDGRNLTYLEFSIYYQHKHYFFNAFTNMQKLKTIKIRLENKVIGKNIHDGLTDTRILESVTRNVEEITLIGFDPRIRLENNFLRILKEFKSLTSLGLEQWDLDSSITKFISQNIQLRHLSLSISQFDPDDLVLKNLTMLESFHMDASLVATQKKRRFLNTSTTHLRHLKSLSIGLAQAERETLLAITQFKNLKELVVFCNQMSQDILHKFKNLIKFDGGNIKTITDTSVKRIIKNNKDLELFSVVGTSITSKTIYYLYDWTKTRKHRAPVLRLLVDEKLFKKTQDSLKLKGDNPYFIVEPSVIAHPVMIPEAKHLHVRERSNSVGTNSIENREFKSNLDLI